MFGRPLTGFLYDGIGARRYSLLLMSAQVSPGHTLAPTTVEDAPVCADTCAQPEGHACSQVLIHALLALQQLAGIASAVLGPLLVFLLFFTFAGAITTWAPLTIDLLQRPAAMPLVLTALPTAQAFSAAIIGTLMQIQGVLAAFRSFICLMLFVHALMLFARCRLLTLCSEATAPLARNEGGHDSALSAREPPPPSAVVAPADAGSKTVMHPPATRLKDRAMPQSVEESVQEPERVVSVSTVELEEERRSGAKQNGALEVEFGRSIQ